MVANMSLKAYEHKYFRYFRQLEKSGEFVPIPTEVSYFHLLDESFHTTMSQVISQEVCKDFPKPTAYEQALANFIVYSAQKGVIGGLSAGLPLVFRADDSFLPSYYRLLKSPLFEMSTADALHWLEKCLCQEHEGLAANVKHHKSLLEDFRRFFGRLDYLWPVNREMKVMAAGNSVERALKNNIESFKRFSRLVNSYSQDNQ